MALTSQQLEDVRRFLGAPASGTDIPTDDSRDMIYGFVSPGVWQTLFHRLKNLTPEAESNVVNVYLANLYKLENAILKAGDNLDTEEAAVWRRNQNEVSDRLSLFDTWRKRLYQYLMQGERIGSSDGCRIVRG